VQKKHFNSISSGYDKNYGDFYSRTYRNVIVFPKLFSGLNLKNKVVLDAMSGGGYCTRYFLDHQVKECYGLDISDELIKFYNERYSLAKGIVGSVTNIPFDKQKFDIVCVHGGIHHTHPDVNKALSELIRVVRPGGYLCFFEPPANTLMDYFRKKWYKIDPLFEENEASIDFKKITKKYSNSLRIKKNYYGGGLAYYFIFNSLITRIPFWLKRIVALPLIYLDFLIDRILPHWLSGYEIVIYEKK
jgi:ubiquinone/menaquinone biosynthesis C-methylase UbiE